MLKSIIFVGVKQGCRCISSRKVINPGVQKRMDIFKDDNPEIDKLSLDEQQFDTYENDFSGASTFYDEHERDKKKNVRTMEFKRIERKYFGTRKSPNLLTWSEKEQIRYLSNSDPATWTPEKLALSFPANIVIIKKILKAQWKPRSNEKIKKHDKAVSNNWKAIETGEIDLHPSLAEHVRNFMSRKENNHIYNIPVKEASLTSVENANKSTSSEFVNIIRSYSKRTETENNQPLPEEKFQSISDLSSETYVLEDKNPVSLKERYYTLEELRKEIKSKDITQEDQPEEVQHFLRGNTGSSSKASNAVESSFPTELLPVSNEFGKLRKREINRSLQYNDAVVENIDIPKNKKKSGSVYKVKDCYYNDEGDFLYKVPGMT